MHNFQEQGSAFTFLGSLSDRSLTPVTIKPAIIVEAGRLWWTHVEFTFIQILGAVSTHITTRAAAVVSIRVITTGGVVLARGRSTMVDGLFTCQSSKSFMAKTFKIVDIILAGRSIFTRVGEAIIVLSAVGPDPVFCAVTCVI
jgi:hypothetical protein